jgi:saccharopine dehydrogenase-like NADP-dependent oxidoreductase
MILGGVGAVATETTKDLFYNSGVFQEIIIADMDLPKAQRLARELRENSRNRLIPEPYRCDANRHDFYKKTISTVQVDASSVPDLVSRFKGVDVVACGLPFKFDLPVTEAAVTAGVNALDLSFSAEQKGFDEKAREAGVTYIPGVGATPGTTNVMVRQGVERLDEAETVHINFAAFRCLAPAPGLLLTTMWEFDPATEERVYYQDGGMIRVPPFTGARRVRFHQLIGEQEVVYIPHPETATVSESYPSVRHVDVRGTFPSHIMRLMKACLEAGLFSHDEMELYGAKTSPFQAIQDLLIGLPEAQRNPVWAYGLVVEVQGKKDGKTVKYTYSNAHPGQECWGGEAAYYKNVGIPLAIGADMLARGDIELKGVVAPELAIRPDIFFSELALRGISITEQVENV